MRPVGTPVVGTDLERLFRAHHAQLVRLAALLTADAGRAEEIVQDAVLGLHRRLGVVRRQPPGRPGSAPPAEDEALAAVRAGAVADAVRRLPAQQRACVVLRYYGGLTDTAIADAVGISPGSVKTHLHRTKATLATALEER